MAEARADAYVGGLDVDDKDVKIFKEIRDTGGYVPK
jgi:hypothetical protein